MMSDIKSLHPTEQEENALTPEEHMESILFQFVNLYERWSEDRQVAAKQGADVARLVKEFSGEVERFSEIEDAVIVKLGNGLTRTTDGISKMVHGAVAQAVDKAFDESARKIQESTYRAERLFAEYQSSLNLSHWKTIAITAVTSIAACLLIVWLLMPKPTLPLTDKQIETYQSGEVFENVWPKLSIKQKQWILDIAKGKVKNHDNFIEENT
jgi:hypothetical protein